ncbi:MAG: tetratricopeptide repeat protein [Chloroflexi bacterium]|nr:tetratricopeptide repeat protein [Chloroflexota bacterium]
MSTWRFIKSWLLYTWGGLHRYFGNQNTMQSEHERAVHYFGRAYDVDPRFRTARLSRAVLLGRELGRTEEALADYAALLADDPQYTPALLNRGLLLQQNGSYTEALQDLQTYLQLVKWGEHRQEAERIVALLQEILADLDEKSDD